MPQGQRPGPCKEGRRVCWHLERYSPGELDMIRTVQYFADFRKKSFKRAGMQYGPGLHKNMHKLWRRKFDPWGRDHFRGQLLHGLCASKMVQVLENPLGISDSPIGCDTVEGGGQRRFHVVLARVDVFPSGKL